MFGFTDVKRKSEYENSPIMSRIFDPPCRWAATAGRALQVLGLLAAVSGCWGAAPSSLAARRSEVELRHDAKSLRLALEDLQPVGEFLVMGIEAARKDAIREVSFRLQLSAPTLVILP